MERKNARTPGRSALAQSCATVEVTLNADSSQGDGDGIHDFAQDGFGGLRFLLQRGVARASHYAMREDGHGKVLEIVGEAVIAAIQEGAGLRGALEHESATGTDAESELI